MIGEKEVTLRNIIRNPYLWMFIGFLLSYLVLGKWVGYLLFYLGVSLHGQTYNSYSQFRANEETLLIYLSFIINILRFVVILFIVYKTKWFTHRKLILKKKDFRYAIYAFFIKAFISIILGILASIPKIGVYFNSGSPNQDKVEHLIQNYIWVGILFSVIIAPLTEEFIFRKLLIGKLFKDKEYSGLIVSSVLFGSLHLMAGFTLPGLILYISLGFILGWLYIRNKRIETSIIAHMFNNFIGTVAVIFKP